MTEKRKIKIISDGTAFGTKVIDPETGKEVISNIRSIQIDKIEPGKFMTATIEVNDPELDILVSAEIKKVPTNKP